MNSFGFQYHNSRLRDHYNQRIVNMYVVKTEKKDGKLVNVVIDQLGKVAQADVWKWWRK